MKRVLLCVTLAACTYDFHKYDQVVADASVTDAGSSDASPSDAAPPTDGGADADATSGCTPSSPCLSSAIACASTCTQAEQTCEGQVGCSLSTTCVQACKADETSCKQKCVDTCVTCTDDAGCSAPLQCRSATQ